MAGNIRLIAHKDPKSPVAEVFRTLRTNIKFASFDKNIQTIVFTSSGPNEGKSTVTSNLAVTLCQTGSRVLMVEGDLRNPTVHRMFGISSAYGLTNILLNNGDYRNFVQRNVIDGLDVIACGPKPPNPSELLGSGKMRNLLQEFKKDYEYIIIDAPPVVVVTDAALLASICDGTILVIGSGQAYIEGAIKAKDLLMNVKANIIGTVLNKCKDVRSGGYYYSYYYENSGEKKKKRSI